MDTKSNNFFTPLILGDFIAFFIVTIIGFASHNSQFDLIRILAIWVPLCLGWSLTAPLLGLWKKRQPSLLENWWKIIWATILSIPLAVVIRGFILKTPTIGTFVLVMIATSLAGLFIWRLLWFFIQKKFYKMD